MDRQAHIGDTVLVLSREMTGIGPKHCRGGPLGGTEFTEYQRPLAGRLNWLPPSPPPQASVSPPPPRIQVGGHTPACGKRVVRANSDEGTDTMVLCMLIPSLCWEEKG
jgi:hypothetical protein